MSKKDTPSASSDCLLLMATDVVAAYVGNHRCGSEELPAIIQTVFATLQGLSEGSSEE